MESSKKPSKLTQIISVGVGLAVCGGLIWLGIWAISQVPSTLTTAVVTGGIAILGSTLAVVIGKNYERKREIEAAFRQRKIEVYDEFFERLFGLFHQTGEQEDLVAYMREHQRRLILWSGDKAIHEYANMMRAFRGGAETARGMLALEKYFLAVREDLGHSNAGVKRGDLISFIMTNGDLLMQFYDENPETAFQRLVELERQQKEQNQR